VNRLRAVSVVVLVRVGLVVRVVRPGSHTVVEGLLVQVTVDALGGTDQRRKLSAKRMLVVNVRDET
jgi:hypothetical protein